jgi:hypothetical protein
LEGDARNDEDKRKSLEGRKKEGKKERKKQRKDDENKRQTHFMIIPLQSS